MYRDHHRRVEPGKPVPAWQRRWYSISSCLRGRALALAETITELAPDSLAVQEVGEPEALADLVDRLDGSWNTALADPDGRGIRVGVLSRLPLNDIEQVVDFPDGLQPIQVDDSGIRMSEMGRPVLRVRVESDGGTTLASFPVT